MFFWQMRDEPPRVTAKTGGGLETLDDNKIFGGIKNLSAFHCSVGQNKTDLLFITYRLGLLNEEQRSGNFGDCLIFLHLMPSVL